jgi:AcrR family transcriptional regulator
MPSPADSSSATREALAGRLPRRPQERSGETRARLVACAIESISELGYTGATTPVIAERAGVTRGALQYHFASREELDVAVIDHVMTELNFRVDADELASQPLEARVDALIDAYWTTFTGPMFRAALNLWLGVVSDPPLARKLQDHLSGRKSRIEQTWKALFKDTGRSGEELSTLRHLVMGAARGHAVERLFNPSSTGQKERALLREMMLHALRGGYAPKRP